jgi:hypothetical protein
MMNMFVRGARAALALLLVAAVAACGDDGDSDTDTAGAGGASGQPEGMAHVHGLGVNPADGSLYVATHYGMWRIAEGEEAERVGPVQDMMGFTVVGADHFVGSGHPGEAMAADGAVNPMGYIESTDAGETWEDVSLVGEVDFHALTYAHDSAYGWSASTAQVLVSSDGEDWDTRAEGVAFLSLAVDPEDPDRMVGVAFEEGRQEGIFRGTTDGGRTWEDLEGVTWMNWLSWDAESGLWTITRQGDVYRTDDPDSGEWTQSGTANGSPVAFLAEGHTLYTATMDDSGTTSILESSDSGETWETLYEGA